MSDREEQTVQALIAIDALVGTLAMAEALVEDPAAAEALHTCLASALTARTMLEAAVDGDPVKEPRKDPTGTMGQEEDDDTSLIHPLRPNPDECEHEDVLTNMDGTGMCVACGEDPAPPCQHTDLLVDGDGGDSDSAAICKSCGQTGRWIE